MGTGKKTVAVVTADREVPTDVAVPLTRHGFAVAAFPFTATLPADAVAVLVLVDGTRTRPSPSPAAGVWTPPSPVRSSGC